MQNIDIIHFFKNSYFLVQLTIIILIFFSIFSWSIIIYYTRKLHFTKKNSKCFEEKFWSSIEFSNLYQNSYLNKKKLFGTKKIFYVGFKEFLRLNQKKNYKPKFIIESVIRIIRVTINRELEKLGGYISFLATVGSVSPYIGLFGTTLGIINIFFSLGSSKMITFQMIAPGVAESLITTAISLCTSIPAVIAYNRLIQMLSKIEQHFENFSEEFIAILYRQLFYKD